MYRKTKTEKDKGRRGGNVKRDMEETNRARNSSDFNKTRERKGKTGDKKRVTDSGHYLLPPSSVIIKAMLSPPSYINTILCPPGAQRGRATLTFCVKKTKIKVLNSFSVTLSEVSWHCPHLHPPPRLLVLGGTVWWGLVPLPFTAGKMLNPP